MVVHPDELAVGIQIRLLEGVQVGENVLCVRVGVADAVALTATMSASSASISCCVSGWTAIRKLREADTPLSLSVIVTVTVTSLAASPGSGR